jgi:outer membrane receptor for Fe3+-dicitrate
VGYASKEITLGAQSNLNVILETDNQNLDEVVVVGYAIGSKRTVSGAVERVGRKDMNKGAVTSAADALKGKVSGVVISQSGGDPMGTPTSACAAPPHSQAAMTHWSSSTACMAT